MLEHDGWVKLQGRTERLERRDRRAGALRGARWRLRAGGQRRGTRYDPRTFARVCPQAPGADGTPMSEITSDAPVTLIRPAAA